MAQASPPMDRGAARVHLEFAPQLPNPLPRDLGVWIAQLLLERKRFAESRTACLTVAVQSLQFRQPPCCLGNQRRLFYLACHLERLDKFPSCLGNLSTT